MAKIQPAGGDRILVEGTVGPPTRGDRGTRPSSLFEERRTELTSKADEIFIALNPEHRVKEFIAGIQARLNQLQ